MGRTPGYEAAASGVELSAVSKLLGASAKIVSWPASLRVVPSRTLPLEATIDGSLRRFVMHTLNFDEVLDEAIASGNGEKSDQKGQRVGDKFVTVRQYAVLLSDELNKPTTVSADDAIRYILEILTELVERHSDDRVHGNIRPENVEIRAGHAHLIDAGFRERYEDLDEDKRLYVAPELRSTERSEGSKSGDVYSFLRFARSLMRPFMGEANVARYEAQWSWMYDAAVVAEPNDRPAAEAVRDAFVARGGRMRQGVDEFLDGFNAGKAELSKESFTWAGGSIKISNQVAKAVRLDIAAAPETSLYVSERVAKHLLMWRAIDSSPADVQNRIYVNFDRHELDLGVTGMDSLPPHVDERWMNRIHLEFFGTGLRPDQQSVVDLATASLADRNRNERYQKYLELVDKVRATILEENTFVHSHEVAALIAGIVPEINALDVVMMRRWGHLLAIPDHDRWLYPVFQFDSVTGLPSPHIKAMNDARAAGRLNPPDEWATIALWDQADKTLGGRAPRDLLWDPDAQDALIAFIGRLARA